MRWYVCDAPSTATSCAAGNGLDGCSAASTRGDAKLRRHSVMPKVLRRLRYMVFTPLLICPMLAVLVGSNYLTSALYERASIVLQINVSTGGASLMPPVLGLSGSGSLRLASETDARRQVRSSFKMRDFLSQ